MGRLFSRRIRPWARGGAAALSLLVSAAAAVFGVADLPRSLLFVGTLLLLLSASLIVDAGLGRTYRATTRNLALSAAALLALVALLGAYHWVRSTRKPQPAGTI